MAGSFETFIDVDLTENAQRAVRTRTGKGVDQVVADTTVLAWIRIAVVDVVFAIGTLETRRTGARVGADQIFAGGSILTGSGITLVDFVLTVTTRVTCDRKSSVN